MEIVSFHIQDPDADMGLAVPFGDVGGIGIGEGDGVAHLDALAALETCVGHEDHIGLALFGGGVIVAVALENGDAAGPAVDKLDLTRQGGFIIVELGQGRGGTHLQDIAAAQGGHGHRGGQDQCDQFTHKITSKQ